MSITSEFDSTIENIKSDYEGLENIGADLTNVNKNIQNIRTCLDNIYDNLPKTTGEGSNLSLTTLRGRINVDDILGDTQQDTYEGYNILNFNSYVVLEDNMLSTSQNNGQILASDIQLQANTTYYFKFILLKKPIASTTITSYIDGTPDITIGQSNIQGGTIGELVTKQITPTSNCILSMAIWGNANAETIKFQYWITTDNTKNTYEPYTGGQASPSPSYPQDINVVTGTQEVVVENKNIYDSNNVIENTLIQPAYNKIGATTECTTIWFKCTPNTTYTLSRDKGDRLVIGGSNTQPVLNGDITILYDVGATEDKTYTFNSGNFEYVAIYISRYNSSKPTQIQIELGSTASSYVEHQEQTKTLHLGDIELAKIGNYQDRISKSSGKQLFDKDNSSLIVQGKDYNGNGVLENNTNWAVGYVPCEANTTYTISSLKTYSGTSIVNVDENKENAVVLNARTGLTNYTFTTTKKGYIGISYVWSASASQGNEQNTLMLNLGSTALPYEPYGSDKWYIEKKVGKVILNGSESGWGTQNDVFCIEINDILTQSYEQRSIIVLSNYFLGAITAYRGGMSNLTIAKTIDGGRPKQLGIRYDALNNVVNDFKTWLSTHNTIVYYVLATPTYTEITNTALIEELNELEKMMSYNGQTNISVSGNLPMILDVSALKGE